MSTSNMMECQYICTFNSTLKSRDTKKKWNVSRWRDKELLEKQWSVLMKNIRNDSSILHVLSSWWSML